jgi:NAD(P)-dependent dehydrogenase (short-subunit alcohol dehydrogenase family)
MIHVTDEGVINKIEGNPTNPSNNGKLGAKVILFDINAEALEHAKEILNGDVETVRGNVTSKEDLSAITKIAGNVDVLVCLTGMFAPAEIGNLDPDLIDKAMAVNVKGTMLAVDAVVPAMSAGSAIVLISSSSHLKPLPGGSLYGASKAAVRGFARNAALDLLPKGIRVNTVCPGPVDTGRMAAPVPVPQEVRDMVATTIPMGRLGDPAEIASAIAFLSSSEASFITGSELTVDGGLCNL